jgi:hypothetical protein
METAIKNIFLISLIMFLSVFAQNDTSTNTYNKIDRFLSFIPESNNIIALVLKGTFKDSISNEWSWNSSIKIWSCKDRDLVKEILLDANENVNAFNVSHNGSTFIIQSTVKTEGKNKISEIKQYSLNKEDWVWTKNWDSDTPCMKVTYNNDNSQIVCITNKNVIIIDSQTGNEVRSSNSIVSYFDEDYTDYTRMALSKYGNSFVFWHNYINTLEYSEELWIMSPFNPLTWPFRLIGALGNLFSGKKYIYIWDVLNDKIMHKIGIPKGVPIGSPAFTSDGDTLFWGPIKDENKLKMFDIRGLALLKEWDDSLVFTHGGDFKCISPNSKYLFEGFRVVEIESGKIIKQFSYERYGDKMRDSYPAAFSLDNEYFVIEEHGKICLYKTESWEEIWSVITENPMD